MSNRKPGEKQLVQACSSSAKSSAGPGPSMDQLPIDSLSRDSLSRDSLAVERARRTFILAVAASPWLITDLAAAEPVSKSSSGGVAIGGHDAVAYHSLARQPQQKAIGGVETFTVEYKGANWHFASKESAERFAASPDDFAPAYNGFCANALSIGNGLVKTDGTHWEIFESQLYLYFAGRGRKRWLDGNWKTYKAAADAEWQKLK